MKVFVAVGSGEGQLAGDIGRATEGEMVWIQRSSPCAECGCGWSVTGLATDALAQVFTVVDRADLDVASYARLMCDAWRRKGWPLPASKQGALDWFARLHLEAAGQFEIGEELSFRRGRLHRTIVTDGRS